MKVKDHILDWIIHRHSDQLVQAVDIVTFKSQMQMDLIAWNS